MQTPFVAVPGLVLVLLRHDFLRRDQPLGCGSMENLSTHWTRVLLELACVTCDSSSLAYGCHDPRLRHGYCGVPGPFSLRGHDLNLGSGSLLPWAAFDRVELHWL